jgi:hypothetical protein
MSIGGNKSPFRIPCEVGDTPRSFLLCKGNHQHAAAVPAFGNTTQMTDHCGNTVPADKRFYQTDTCGLDICAPNCNDCPGGVNLLTNTPEPPSISDNTFSESGTVQLEPTEKVGSKGMQAAKIWHGARGFLDRCNGVDGNTKYLTATFDLHYDVVWDDTDGITNYTFTSSGSGSRSVARLSGVITSDLETFEDDSHATDSNGGGGASTDTLHVAGGAGWRLEESGVVDYTHGLATMVDAAAAFDSDCGTPQIGSDGFFAHGETAEELRSGWNGAHPDYPFPDITDPDSYDETVTYNPIGLPSATYRISWSRTNTVLSWDVDYSGTAGDGQSAHFYGSITLSDPYTINDCLADAATNADEYSLTDDLKYPYRIDQHTTVAPLVLRNERGTPISPLGFNTFTVDDYTSPIGTAPYTEWDQRAWFNPSAYEWIFPSPSDDQASSRASDLLLLYDGSIIGNPLDAGYGQGSPRGVFDKDHENFFRKNCDPGPGWTQASESRGAYTPSFLPSNAQKWTDDFTATHLWPCAFINADVSGIYLQKWAETKIKRPSANFARPFGPDKFSLDETSVYYVSDFTAGVVTLQTVDFATPVSLPFTTSDIVGSAAVGGFFAVTSVGADTVTLGSKVYDLPTDWETPSKDVGFCFGKLKYPDAPGMNFTDETKEVGGRVRVTVTNSSPVTLTTGTSQKYLSITTAENIDILAADNTVLASNVAATRVDDVTFQVPTAFATIASAKWIVPHGTKYKFADSRSKGDYVYRTWLVRMSDASVLSTSQTDACLPIAPCSPSVAGISPNGETGGNAHYWAFPTSINNGEVWLGRIDFWMTDPFWQEPHKPVQPPADILVGDFAPGTDIILWAEDDGSCQTNSAETGGGGEIIYHLFYPMRPYVEARCTLPDDIDGESTPSLASGVDLTTVQDPPSQAGIGDVEGPLVDAIIVPTPSWVKMLAQRACVAASGAFAADYEANDTTA